MAPRSSPDELDPTVAGTEGLREIEGREYYVIPDVAALPPFPIKYTVEPRSAAWAKASMISSMTARSNWANMVDK